MYCLWLRWYYNGHSLIVVDRDHVTCKAENIYYWAFTEHVCDASCREFLKGKGSMDKAKLVT